LIAAPHTDLDEVRDDYSLVVDFASDNECDVFKFFIRLVCRRYGLTTQAAALNAVAWWT